LITPHRTEVGALLSLPRQLDSSLMTGLMMMEPDPKKQYCRVKGAKRKGSRVKYK
jgi:hypothetical protein